MPYFLSSAWATERHSHVQEVRLTAEEREIRHETVRRGSSERVRRDPAEGVHRSTADLERATVNDDPKPFRWTGGRNPDSTVLPTNAGNLPSSCHKCMNLGIRAPDADRPHDPCGLADRHPERSAGCRPGTGRQNGTTQTPRSTRRFAQHGLFGYMLAGQLNVPDMKLPLTRIPVRPRRARMVRP